MLLVYLTISLVAWFVDGRPPKFYTAPTLDYEVVQKLPHDPDAFTEGLFYTNGTFVESTGLSGQSFIKQWIPETGEIINTFETPDRQFGEGVVQHENYLYHVTYKAGTGYVVDATTWEIVRKWSYKGEGWGLTVHPTEPWIYMSDGSEYIRILSPDTLEEIAPRLHVTDGGKGIDYINELEFINGEIWANVWQSPFVLRIDPTTGKVNSVLDFEGILTREDYANGKRPDVLNGIAYDPDTGRIWVTGKWYPFVFEITVKELATTQSTSTATSEAVSDGGTVSIDKDTARTVTTDTTTSDSTTDDAGDATTSTEGVTQTVTASEEEQSSRGESTSEEQASVDAVETSDASESADQSQKDNDGDIIPNENGNDEDGKDDTGGDAKEVQAQSQSLTTPTQNDEASVGEEDASAETGDAGNVATAENLSEKGITLDDLEGQSAPSESKLYIVTGVTGLFAFVLIGAYIVFRRKPNWFRGEPNYDLEMSRRVTPADNGQSPAYAFLMDNDSDNEEFDDW